MSRAGKDQETLPFFDLQARFDPELRTTLYKQIKNIKIYFIINLLTALSTAGKIA